MFKQNEFGWVGFPRQPWHSFFEENAKDKSHFNPSLTRVLWLTLNISQFPLNNLKLRQSLSLSLNRREIAHIFKEGKPAFSPLPPHQAHFAFTGTEIGDKQSALRLYNTALKELGLTPKMFPTLHLAYPEGEKRELIAKIISQRLSFVLGLNICCKGYPWSSFLKKLTSIDYEIATIYWTSLEPDSFHTLDIFKSSNHPMNFPKWDNIEYQNILAKAADECNDLNQSSYLQHAEAVLIREAPIIPIIYEADEPCPDYMMAG